MLGEGSQLEGEMIVRGIGNRGAGKAALMGLSLAGACIGAATPAPASILTFTLQGAVASFIDNNNVFGFGAGANLAGDSITDVYTIDTAYSTFSSSQPYGPGSAAEEYNGAFGGMSRATSTIDGHTVTFNAVDGHQLTAATQQLYLGEGTPPNPYNQSILELQAIGLETTGDGARTEFLIRDEAVSYSLRLPLSLLTAYNFNRCATSTAAARRGRRPAVFFSYPSSGSPDSDAGSSNLTFGSKSRACPNPRPGL